MTANIIKTFLLLVVIWVEGIVAKGTLEERVGVLEHKLARQQAILDSTESKSFSSAPASEAYRTGCPYRFDRAYGEFCYFFSDEKVTWDVAKEECKTLNNRAFLAEIRTSDENQYLRLETMRVGGNRWIGLEDVNGRFKWTWFASHTVLHPGDYDDWASGEPNNQGWEKCVHFYDEKAYHWNNMICNRKFTYVCQVERNETNLTTDDEQRGHDGFN